MRLCRSVGQFSGVLPRRVWKPNRFIAMLIPSRGNEAARMYLAHITSDERGGTDRLLARFASHLVTDGVRLAGVVQTNSAPTDNGRCDMDLRVLPHGPVVRISQSLGGAARGCRLDSAALQEAVSAAAAGLTVDTALLVVNKFGKREADGSGFRDLIGQALLLDVPVLLGLKPSNRAAFDAFAGGMAEELPEDLVALNDWFSRVAAARKMAS